MFVDCDCLKDFFKGRPTIVGISCSDGDHAVLAYQWTPDSFGGYFSIIDPNHRSDPQFLFYNTRTGRFASYIPGPLPIAFDASCGFSGLAMQSLISDPLMTSLWRLALTNFAC
jgi:hypothetical protein